MNKFGSLAVEAILLAAFAYDNRSYIRRSTQSWLEQVLAFTMWRRMHNTSSKTWHQTHL